MNSARAAAIVTWVYAAGFGLAAVPVSIYLSQNGRLPTFLGLFEMYGGPWSASVRTTPLSYAFLRSLDSRWLQRGPPGSSG